MGQSPLVDLLVCLCYDLLVLDMWTVGKLCGKILTLQRCHLNMRIYHKRRRFYFLNMFFNWTKLF